MELELAGTDNFRSLKGMPAHGGRRIGDHVLLRSDQLHMLDGEGWKVLDELGVRTVCDLRSKAERLRIPNHLPPGLQQLALDVSSDMRADQRIAMVLAQNPSPAGAQTMMFEVYRRLPGMLAPHLTRLFGLFESGAVPVLIHCAAGKDRTGFAVATLLHALGVPREYIIADYQLSARRMAEASEARREVMSKAISAMIGQPCSDETIDVVMDARPDYLHTAYARVNDRYGSMEGYLLACAGLDEPRLQRLQDRWLMAD